MQDRVIHILGYSMAHLIVRTGDIIDNIMEMCLHNIHVLTMGDTLENIWDGVVRGLGWHLCV